MNSQSRAAGHAISLPEGGGAIGGIGETFQPNLFTGTGNHSIPIATSPGRSGFGPTLSLQYSSGSGNGPFGLGWTLAIPRITRKTEKGLPRYDDTDVFVLSGAEDLVPCLTRVVDPVSRAERWVPEDPVHHPNHTARRYRPRTEGLFARIERWEHDATGEVHWRSITRDNITSIYGAAPPSRLADPDDERRVSEWLLEETFDDRGNHILYEYARDHPGLYSHADPTLQLPEIHEQNRRATQLYIRRIYYGNLPDLLVDTGGNPITYADGRAIGHLRGGRRYAFEVVFDYGDWEIPPPAAHPDPPPAGAQELFGAGIPLREDRFSRWRAGFEIRTLRRCRCVLMFHHFAELGGPTLVRSTDFGYRQDPDTHLSLLAKVTVTGYRRNAEGGYSAAATPPATFVYSELRPHEQRYQSIAAIDGDGPARALGEPGMALVDLFGDGLPDVLQSTAGGLRYWRNLGSGVLDRPRTLSEVPSVVSLAQPGVGFGDMGGDGQVDLLALGGAQPGFFETTAEETWRTFRPYEFLPSFSLSDGNVRLLDLTGNGLSDALQTGPEQFVWFECLGEQGYGPPRFVARQHDLDRFPDVFFDDPAGRVRLADMTGDGLNDIVLVHDGRVEYWPNLGDGRFGARITMGNAPRLDEPSFDPRRLFLADLTGTGCADLVYVEFDRVHVWFNRSGNTWSDRQRLAGTPPSTDVESIGVADVFGMGTAAIVWSYPFSAQPDGNYKALDLCGGVKPYLLVEIANGLGATTRVSYAPSTRHFLDDQAEGTPWMTKLPFPVQVVDRIEVIDRISRTRLVNRFRYHHGYFDGREREFRGFGRVDRFDTETFEDFTRSSLHEDSPPIANGSAAYHAAPVETRTWFHTGICFDEGSIASVADEFDRDELTRRYRREFYQGDAGAVPLGEQDVQAEETPHEAHRALRGAVLRTEVYGRDGSAREEHPYTVVEHRHRVVRLQPRAGTQPAVYFRHEVERLTSHYERRPDDPRVGHAFTLEVDAFGNVLRSLTVGYGRRHADPSLPTQADRDTQARTYVAYKEAVHTNAIDDPDRYRTPLECEQRTFELTGIPPGAGGRFSVEEWIENDFARIEGLPPIPFEAVPDPSIPQKRLVDHVRTYYRADDLTDLLPLGRIEAMALPGESHRLALTSGLVEDVFGSRVSDSTMTAEGGYRHSEGDDDWWVASGRTFYSVDSVDTPAEELASARRHFFCVRRTRDSFGNEWSRSYDPYDLLLSSTTDPLGNRTAADNDYRVLQPFRVTDANGNRSEAAFDALGLVAGTAVMGKAAASDGDSLAGFAADLSPGQREVFFADPLGQAAQLLGPATTRVVSDFDRFRAHGQPVFTATIARETHGSDPLPPGGPAVQVHFSYSDGFGRQVQQKARAEPGPVANGGPDVDARWVASGWTVLNNKGKPVKQYEPFFDDTHEFRFAREAGISPTLFYDSAERVVATLRPDHAWSKVVFDPWRQETWDFNDTALVADPAADPDAGEHFRRLDAAEYLPSWHGQRAGGLLGEAERQAALKTAVHAATPEVAVADSLGRTFLTIAHNRFERSGAAVEEFCATRIALDIQGRPRAVVDAVDRVVMRCDYDLLGRRIRQASMDAGERRTLHDVAGYPILAWDGQDRRLRTTYDGLARPTATFLASGAGPEQMVGRAVYGEALADAEARNLRGQVARIFDQAGVVTNEAYDFKGNLVVSRRLLTADFRGTIDWLTDPELEAEVFERRASYDALNRQVSTTAPDGSVHRVRFNRRNLLERVEVGLLGAQSATVFVSRLDYDAKGQRRSIEYGNGVRTDYEYDPLTFRLTRLTTTRSSDQSRLQDLACAYDAAGHLTSVRDDAQPAIFFANQTASADADYTYDAIYRLIGAKGREHVGQHAEPQTTWDDRFRTRLPHPADGQAMRRYTERYEYDLAGNLLKLVHQASGGDWTRRYEYDEASLVEPGRRGNRLSRTVVGAELPEPYAHDAHGNMTAMPHLLDMAWDHRDQLRRVDLGGGGTAHYVNDSSGRRVRKVVERSGGTLVEERLYLGGFEIFRRRDAAGTVASERQTLHVMDGERRIALVETALEAGSPVPRRPLARYQCADRVGSAALELDDEGRVISYEEYYPFGATSYQALAAEAPHPKRYRHAAKERDEETGLAHFGARYYAPWLGRWTAVDPAVLRAGDTLARPPTTAGGGPAAEPIGIVAWSPFAYCSNDPINRTDPSGAVDYYNKEGEFVGNDGRSDRSVLILLDERDVRTVQGRYSGSWWQRHRGEILGTIAGALIGALAGLLLVAATFKAIAGGLILGGAIGYLGGRFLLKDRLLPKQPTSVNELVGERLELPSERVRAEIRAALERSNAPTSPDPSHPDLIVDSEGGFHEEGGFWGRGPQGEEVIGRARPGNVAHPRDDRQATINVFDLVTPVPGDRIVGTFHIHPGGEIKEGTAEERAAPTTTQGQTLRSGGRSSVHNFNQPPSAEDIGNVQARRQDWAEYQYSIVVGARSGEVYFYRETNTPADPYLAKLPTSVLFRGLR